MITGNSIVDEFFKSLDYRISAADQTTPEESKARLRKMRPYLCVVAEANPKGCEQIIRRHLKRYQ